MPLFWRRTEALSSCASILEEKGALTRSSSLYFRGEGRSYCLYVKAERNLYFRGLELLPLEEKGAVKRAERNLFAEMTLF